MAASGCARIRQGRARRLLNERAQRQQHDGPQIEDGRAKCEAKPGMTRRRRDMASLVGYRQWRMMTRGLEHDLEKVEPVFGKIMLKQKDVRRCRAGRENGSE